ncbi:MAG: methyltransferase domain-containing protein [Chloroflexi bacterium]|nr:methyltransferase domain-containing protein [Chloroflexota bacterium]
MRLHGSHTHDGAPKMTSNMGRWAPYYDTITRIMTLGQERAIRAASIEIAGVKPGDTVLEVGCGTGTLTLAAKARVGSMGKVYGIDVAPEMLAVARRKAARQNLDIVFGPGRIEDIPFPDNQFDVVLGSFMIHHFPGDDVRRKGFAEVQRVLKPNGRLLIVDLEPPTGFPMNHLAPLLYGRQMMQNNNRKLLPMLEAAGFIDIAMQTQFKVIAFILGTAHKA